MKYIRNLLKISILLLLFLVCLGSIYAADEGNVSLTESPADDVDLEDNLDDFNDEDLDENLDDEDDDLDDNLDDELDEGIDVNESDYTYSDFDFLKFKITHYLDRYGNCSYHNWTESDEFLNEYQIYRINPSDYTLNESSEGYQTYLKIFDSITSTFNEYNLTENETGYLKFMVIFYLNHYGNVSANYTWNESESFANYTPPLYSFGALADIASGCASSSDIHSFIGFYNINPLALNNITDTNSTFEVNGTDFSDIDANNEVPWWNYLILILVVIMMALIFV